MKPEIANVNNLQVNHSQVAIKEVIWQNAEHALRAVRTPVFIQEQLVTPEFEWDGKDASAVHLLALSGEEAIACLRIINDQKIGRMAVLKDWRGMGIGMALIQKALEIIKNNGEASAYLSAQTHAIGFYERAGFVVTSEEYCDVDIPHVDMEYQFVK